MGEVAIHRAFTWMQKPETQCKALELHKDRQGITRVIVKLQSKHHAPQTSEERLDVARIAEALNAMPAEAKLSVLWARSHFPGGR